MFQPGDRLGGDPDPGLPVVEEEPESQQRRIRGIPERDARRWGGSGKGYWRIASSGILQVALPNTYWDHLGLNTLSHTWQRLYQTA